MERGRTSGFAVKMKGEKRFNGAAFVGTRKDQWVRGEDEG